MLTQVSPHSVAGPTFGDPISASKLPLDDMVVVIDVYQVSWEQSDTGANVMLEPHGTGKM